MHSERKEGIEGLLRNRYLNRNGYRRKQMAKRIGIISRHTRIAETGSDLDILKTCDCILHAGDVDQAGNP